MATLLERAVTQKGKKLMVSALEGLAPTGFLSPVP